MRYVLVPLVLSTMFVIPSSRVGAQATSLDSVLPDPQMLFEMTRFRQGTPVRLWSKREIIEGRVDSTSRGLIFVRAAGVQRQLAARDIDGLWVKRHSTRKYAQQFAVANAVTWGVLGLAAAGSCSQDTGGQCGAAAFGSLVFAGLGATTGAMVGALVGRFSSHWEERYPFRN